MIEGGCCFLQRAINEQLPKGRGEQIFATHDLADLHGVVVDRDGELIGRDIVASPDDEITEVSTRHRALWSETQVDEADLFAVGYAESPIHILA